MYQYSYDLNLKTEMIFFEKDLSGALQNMHQADVPIQTERSFLFFNQKNATSKQTIPSKDLENCHKHILRGFKSHLDFWEEIRVTDPLNF